MAIRKWRAEAARKRSRRYGVRALIFNATLLLAAAVTLPAAAAPARLLLLGDSLIAGYGLPKEDGFVATLGRALDAAGAEVELLDAGVSGDTTAGGKSRIAWSLGDKPTHAVVALGANDALRGLPPEAAYQNLSDILTRLEAAGIPTLLVGMRAPRNWGEAYTQAFDAIYPKLAAAHDVPLYPFLLEGVALEPSLNQADGIHPNAAGVEAIVHRIAPDVLALLEKESGA